MNDNYNCPFDNIDYSFLENANPTCFMQGPDDFLSLESPPASFERDFCENFGMEIEENFQALEEENREIPRFGMQHSQSMMIRTDAGDSLDIFPPKKPTGKIRIIIEIDDDLLLKFANQRKAALEDETISVSTKDSILSPGDPIGKLCFETSFDDVPLQYQGEWRTTLSNFLEKRPAEERTYIERVMPHLMSSLREAFTAHQQPVLNKTIFETMLRELVYGKEAVISLDHKLLRNIVGDEIDEVKRRRPAAIGYGNESPLKRKDKKIVKGNVNNSSLNHMNENYVSNIFKFAKMNYPEDKELQKISNQRGVSATNFRNSMNTQLNDDIFARKAKVRIIASGQEFVNNLEYWMQVGFFENCKDKDKYVQYKQKAICNLSLDRQY